MSKLTKSDIERMTEEAMVKMSIRYDFFAVILAKLGLEIVERPDNDATAWTEGKKVTLNASALIKGHEQGQVIGRSGKLYDLTVTKDKLIFIIAHELMHIIGLTFDRGLAIGIPRYAATQEDLDKGDLWNIASDYEINYYLCHHTTHITGHPAVETVGKMPNWGLYDEKYANYTAEEIYKELLQEDKQQQQQRIKLMGKGNHSDNDDQGSNKQKESADGNGENKKGNDNRSGFDGVGITLDDHLDINDPMVKATIGTILSQVFGSTLNGTGDTLLDRILHKAYTPLPFDWKQALTKYIRGWMRDNYTWNRPARSGISRGLILPSSGKTPKMHIAVAVDTSGSIYDAELEAMMNHLFTILQQFKDFTIDVWCCGSRVYEESLRTFTSKNKNKLSEFKFMSDGGNDMRENFKFLKSHYRGEKPDVFICMTDGYDPIDGDTETLSPCPTIFLILDHANFKAPSKIKSEVYPFKVVNNKG